jgi:hypothetical protein
MKWTVLWFRHQENVWKQRAEVSMIEGKKGHASYAWKQVEMWAMLAKQGENDLV